MSIQRFLIFCLFCCLVETIRAQKTDRALVPGDTTQLHGMGLVDRSFYVGTVLPESSRDSVRFQLRSGIRIAQPRRKVLDLVLLEQDGRVVSQPANRYRSLPLTRRKRKEERRNAPPLHTELSNNYILPIALPRKRGTISYRNVFILYNEFDFAITERVDVGLLGILSFPNNGGGVGFYGLRGRYVQPIREKLHVGGALLSLIVDDRGSFFRPSSTSNVQFPHFFATAGDRQHNVTMGYGYSLGNNPDPEVPDRGPVLFLGTNHRFGPSWQVAAELVLPLTGTTVQFGNLSFYRTRRKSRWEFGMLYFADENFGVFPMIGWSGMF